VHLSPTGANRFLTMLLFNYVNLSQAFLNRYTKILKTFLLMFAFLLTIMCINECTNVFNVQVLVIT